MIRLYLIALLALLLTEYGFQARQTALTRFLGAWPLRRTLIRLALWLGAWVLSGRPLALPGLGGFLAAAVLTEVSVWLLRRRLRRDVAAGSGHGRIDTHLLPLLLALPAALAAWPLLAPGPVAGPLPLSALKLTVGFVSLWCWATLVTVSVIDRVRPESLPAEEGGEVGAGEVIGVLERLLAFVLILHQAPTAVAIGIAAKSAVRFPEFKDKQFAEYFLIGTLTSIGIGILAAVLSLL